MNRGIKVALIAAFVLSVIFAVRVMMTQPSDEQKIMNALSNAIKAGREGRPGPVLDFLSRNITFNDEYVEPRMEINKFIRTFKPDVSFSTKNLQITGETAILAGSATVKSSLPNVAGQQQYDNLVVHLRKRTAFAWLIIPVSKWEVETVTTSENQSFGSE